MKEKKLVQFQPCRWPASEAPSVQRRKFSQESDCAGFHPNIPKSSPLYNAMFLHYELDQVLSNVKNSKILKKILHAYIGNEECLR